MSIQCVLICLLQGWEDPRLHVRLEGHGERHGRMLWPHRREERLGVDRIRQGHEEGGARAWGSLRGGKPPDRANVLKASATISNSPISLPSKSYRCCSVPYCVANATPVASQGWDRLAHLVLGTPPKTNIEPESISLEEDLPFGYQHFRVPCSFSEGYATTR